jgi:hypothetical protein
VAVEPQDIEDVIAAVEVPGHLAVEDDFIDRHPGNRRCQRRQILRQPIPRIELHVLAPLVGEQPDAVKLPLEQPLVAREPLLRQRRGHRLEPLWHLCRDGHRWRQDTVDCSGDR